MFSINEGSITLFFDVISCRRENFLSRIIKQKVTHTIWQLQHNIYPRTRCHLSEDHLSVSNLSQFNDCHCLKVKPNEGMYGEVELVAEAHNRH
jgi:hypothetical protein